MASNAPQTSASDRLQQTRGPLNNDGTTMTRSANINTTEQSAHKVDAESFINTNTPQINSGGFVKDGVHQGAFTNYNAKKGKRGLTSQHLSAMQDAAVTGEFHLKDHSEDGAKDDEDQIGLGSGAEEELDDDVYDDDDRNRPGGGQATPSKQTKKVTTSHRSESIGSASTAPTLITTPVRTSSTRAKASGSADSLDQATTSSPE